MSGKADKGENMNAGLSAGNSAGKRDCFARSDSAARKLAEQESANRDFESRDFDGHDFVERVLIENGLELPVPVESNSTVKSETVKSETAEPEATESQTAEQAAQSGTESGSAAGPAAEPDSVSGASGRAPRLRFAGFTEPWQEKKFSDLAVIRRGLTYKPGNVVSEGIRVLRSSNINEDVFELHDDDVFVEDESVNIPYVENGDILITSANGSNRLVGKHALICGIEENSAVHGGFMLAASSAVPDFVNALMGSSWYSKFISTYVAGGNGAIGNLKKSDLDEQPVFVPSDIEEQRLVGRFFSGLDRIISVQERKTELLRLSKKYFLQNMFPRRGESAPRLRFAGFTEPWQTKKFSDFTYASSVRNKDNLDLVPYAITNEHGFIPQNEAHDEFGYMKNTDRSAYRIVSPDSFGYNPARINIGSIGFYDGCDDVIVSSLYEIFKTDESVDDRFLSYWFKTNDFQNWIARLQEGSVRLYFYYDKLRECKIPVPPSVGEQRQIGMFFSGLDRIIRVQERKTEALRRAKKYYLQNMFA